MSNLEQIIQTIKNEKPHLEKKYSLKEIGIFGSYIKGQANEESDVDLLVDFGQPVSLFKLAQMENYLSDLLHTKVDLVMKDALKPYIGIQILSEVQYL